MRGRTNIVALLYANMEELTFKHIFSRTVSATIKLPAGPPAKGACMVPIVEWTGKPKLKHFAQYRQWVLHVQQMLVDRWQTTTLYALGVGPKLTELWAFEPGTAPKLIEKIPYGL
jgi:hypothetical protein